MKTKNICFFIVIAILNACTTVNQTNQNIAQKEKPLVTPSVTTSIKPSPIATIPPNNIAIAKGSTPPSNEPNVISTIATSTPHPNVISTIATGNPTPEVTPTIQPTPKVTPSATPTPITENKAFILSSEEIKKITDSNIVKANNTFGIKLFKDIVKEQKNENVFISPASAALALQMTYNGADKETKDEMTTALELGSLNLEEVNNLNKLLIKKLATPAPDITLQVANSLWAGKDRVKIKEEFKNTLTNFYKAESNELDFSDEKSVGILNSWASDNTNGKITKIIDSIDPKTVLYIMNAIYFKADWTEKFKKEETVNRDFTLANGTKKQAPLMSSFRDFRYYSNYNRYTSASEILPENRFQGAELTYGKDSRVSLFLFLPDQASSLEKFYSQLTEENLEKWFKGFYYTQGYISFPKFKLKWEKELKDNLSTLGMKIAFNKLENPNITPNFTKLGTSSLGKIFISSVLQSTYVDVNEEGSEAAAVTVVVGGTTSSAPTPRFVADRPFLYMIRDNETKSILFMGAVNEPKYE